MNAAPPPQSQPVGLTFDAINREKYKNYKTKQEADAAISVDHEGCKAAALQTALNTPQQAPAYAPPPAPTYTQNAPIVAIQPPNGIGYVPLPQVQTPDSSASIAAYQAGFATQQAINAERMRQELAKSVYLSCMGQKGWVLRQ